MGVPKFAAWLTKKYPGMVMDRCPADVHGLYIDLNGLIHPCCHDEHDKTVALRTEVEKLRSICLAIETLVVTVRPQHVLYIAIDGVAPRAKMNQQRARRYMSAASPLTNAEKPISGGGAGGSHEISAGVVAAIEKEFTSAQRTEAAAELEDVNQALFGDVLYGGGGVAVPKEEAQDTGFAPTLGHSRRRRRSVDGEEGTATAKMVSLAAAAATTAAPPTNTHTATAAAEAEANGAFDSNGISPGTAFMDRVAAAVRDFVQRKMTLTEHLSGSDADEVEPVPLATATVSTDKLSSQPLMPTPTSPWSKCTVVFSDSNTAGEGEHKLLDFLRTQSSFSGFNGNGCHVIAGLDADLIFLSLSLHIPRVVILRDHERSSYDKALLPITAGGTLKPAQIAEARRDPLGKLDVSTESPFASSIASPTAAPTSDALADTLPISAVAPGVAQDGGERAEKAEDPSIMSSPTTSEASTATPPTTEMGAVEEAPTHAVPGSETDDEVAALVTDVASPVRSPLSPASPGSPPASPAPPPHIATISADINIAYEYYNMDVVGSSVVSEIYQLCLEKNVTISDDVLANPANHIASNGFEFHLGMHGDAQSSEKPAGEKGEDSNRKTTTKSKTMSGPAAAAAASASLSTAPPFHPCTASCNSKIIDDFIVLGMLLGNDFLPHSPSVYCGESAMDTLMDVYVSAVLPHGYLTGGASEIQLVQLERFLRAYAAVEAMRFRQFAIQSGRLTPQEAATPALWSEADYKAWRDTYVRSTSLRDEAGVQAACRAYVEGLRFVWRYYSSISLEVSWTWYYPFHHAPLALDIADFLKAQGPLAQATLPPPKVERDPPQPFCQLLCILPPTSRRLVPAALRDAMTHPSAALRDTFPRQWVVDYTGAFGRDHLAAVLLPFANLPQLQELVNAAAEAYTPEEQRRNVLRSAHLVVESRANTPATVTVIDGGDTIAGASAARQRAEGRSALEGKAAAASTTTATAAPPASRRFRIQGSGVSPLDTAAVPHEFQRASKSLVCSALADVKPPLIRPRTYSYTVPIPGLTVLPDGTRVPVERRPMSRYGGNRRGGGRGSNKSDKASERSASPSPTPSSGPHASGADAAKPAMLFGEFLVALVVFGIAAAAFTVCHGASLGESFALMLQLSSVGFGVLGLSLALGLAVANKGRGAGSGLHRHNIFTAFADWQCARCLSLNFARNRRCFICRAPYDPPRCVAVFSGRNAPEPPLMDPDHSAYGATYGITSL